MVDYSDAPQSKENRQNFIKLTFNKQKRLPEPGGPNPVVHGTHVPPDVGLGDIADDQAGIDRARRTHLLPVQAGANVLGQGDDAGGVAVCGATPADAGVDERAGVEGALEDGRLAGFDRHVFGECGDPGTKQSSALIKADDNFAFSVSVPVV